MPQEVTGQEPPNPKDVQIQQLQAEKEQLRQENKLLKEKGFWCKLLKGSASCDNGWDDGTRLGTGAL